MQISAPEAASLHLDVGLTNDAAELVILLADKRTEIGAAYSDRIEALGDELRLDLRGLHCAREPAGELGDRLLWRLRRGKQSEPTFEVVIAVSGLADGRQVRLGRDPGSRSSRKHAQLAGFRLLGNV